MATMLGLRLLALVFVLVGAEITFQQPSQGDVWQSGSIVQSSWRSSTGVGGSVRVELWQGGLLHSVLLDSAPETVTHEIAVPLFAVPGNDYRVHVVPLGSPEQDTFSGYLTITSAMTSPAPGQQVYAGSELLVTWHVSAGSFPPYCQSVKFRLCRVMAGSFGGMSCSHLADADVEAGTLSTWVPTAAEASPTVVELVCARDLSLRTQSAVFSVLSPVKMPTVTTVWASPTIATAVVQCRPASFYGVVTAELHSRKEGFIASLGVIPSGESSLTVRQGLRLPACSDCYVKLSSTANGPREAVSAEFVVALAPLFDPVPPQFRAGSELNLRWFPGSRDDQDVSIHFVPDSAGANDTTVVLASGVTNLGSLSVVVPWNLPAGWGRLRIELAGLPQVASFSDRVEIRSAISEPNSGTRWLVEDEVSWPIEWQTGRMSSGRAATIELLRSDGQLIRLADVADIRSGSLVFGNPMHGACSRRVRLREALELSDPFPDSAWSEPFRILTQLKILSPAAGFVARADTGGHMNMQHSDPNDVEAMSIELRWDPGTIPERVVITLWSGTKRVATVAGSTPNVGSLSWPLPAHLPAHNDYRVVIQSILEPQRLHAESEPFTIATDPLVLGPANTTLLIGGQTDITWRTGRSPGRVELLLLKAGSPLLTIATLANPTDFEGHGLPWRPSQSIKPGTDFQIQLRRLNDDGTVRTTTVGPRFAIARPGVPLVTMPFGGFQWSLQPFHSARVVELEMNGANEAGRVSVWLQKGGNPVQSAPKDLPASSAASVAWRPLAVLQPGVRRFVWDPAAHSPPLQPASDYCLALMFNGTKQIQCADHFALVAPSALHVVSPPPDGSAWYSAGSRLRARWLGGHAMRFATVTIHRDGVHVVLLANATANTGETDLALPAWLPTSSAYELIVQNAERRDEFAVSAPFTVVNHGPPLVLTPNNGTSAMASMRVEVSWTGGGEGVEYDLLLETFVATSSILGGVVAVTNATGEVPAALVDTTSFVMGVGHFNLPEAWPPGCNTRVAIQQRGSPSPADYSDFFCVSAPEQDSSFDWRTALTAVCSVAGVALLGLVGYGMRTAVDCRGCGARVRSWRRPLLELLRFLFTTRDDFAQHGELEAVKSLMFILGIFGLDVVTTVTDLKITAALHKDGNIFWNMPIQSESAFMGFYVGVSLAAVGALLIGEVGLVFAAYFRIREGRGDAAQWCRRQQRKLWSFQFLTALLALTKLGAYFSILNKVSYYHLESSASLQAFRDSIFFSVQFALVKAFLSLLVYMLRIAKQNDWDRLRESPLVLVLAVVLFWKPLTAALVFNDAQEQYTRQGRMEMNAVLNSCMASFVCSWLICAYVLYIKKVESDEPRSTVGQLMWDLRLVVAVLSEVLLVFNFASTVAAAVALGNYWTAWFVLDVIGCLLYIGCGGVIVVHLLK